jgi:hypothetical protein
VFRTKSRSERAVERAQADLLKARAALLKEKVAPTATLAKENAAHAAEVAREWASPRLEKAREKGVEKAAPRVEHAAEVLAPKVDAARDKIVEDLLPRLVDAITTAAAVAAAKTEEAREASQHGLASVHDRAHDVTHPPERRTRRRRFLVFGVLAAAAGAGYAAWRQSQPADDPWVTATGGGTTSRLSGGDASGGLGAGSLASESTDVDTPVPDGLATGSQQVMDGGEVGSERATASGVQGDKTGADAESITDVLSEEPVGDAQADAGAEAEDTGRHTKK